MKTELTLSLLSLAWAGVHTAAKGPVQQKLPNILCITCEDISPMIGCFGDEVAVTPHLDRFSERAIRYTHMYSNVGVSSPSRYSLITGRYSTADGANYMRTTGAPHQKPKGIKPYSVILEPGIKCYTEYLRAAGYYCTNNPKTDYQFNTPATAWDDCSRTAHWKNRPAGQPFFAIFNLGVTHESQTWTRTDKPLSVNPDDIKVPPYYPDTRTVRHDMAVVYSNITEMDRQFQALCDELKEAGELENTIIIWFSDNGGPLPHHKREIYDRGTRVPFMIALPDGYGAGSVSSQLVSFVDIPATILSLAGIQPPKNMHGIPFLGKYQARKERAYVYGGRDRMDECIDKQGYITDQRYRYIRNYFPGTVNYINVKYRLNLPMMRELLAMNEAGKLDEVQSAFFNRKRSEEEFYDREKDPFELHNLIGDPAYAGEIARLRKAYDQWIDKYNRNWMETEQESIHRMLPDGKQPQAAVPTAKLKKGRLQLSSATEGASINYRIVSASGEKGNWQIYVSPVQLKAGEKVEAVAARIGYKNSEVYRQE